MTSPRERAEWRLTSERINELQIDSIRKTLPMLRAAHFTNLRIRIDGEWREIECDWLKHMVEVPPTWEPAPPPPASAVGFAMYGDENVGPERTKLP